MKLKRDNKKMYWKKVSGVMENREQMGATVTRVDEVKTGKIEVKKWRVL